MALADIKRVCNGNTPAYFCHRQRKELYKVVTRQETKKNLVDFWLQYNKTVMLTRLGWER
jgi:hypothetical protein